MKVESLNSGMNFSLHNIETGQRSPQKTTAGKGLQALEDEKVVTNTKDPELREKIGQLAEAVEGFLQVMGTELKFNIDERTDHLQVEVIDPDKDKVIQKIPPDDLLKLAASIEDMVGVFVDKAF